MKRRTIAILCAAVLALGLIGCSEKEETTSTVTGMVVAVEGTVVTLQEFNMNAQGGAQGQGGTQGQRPSGDRERPEGNFTMPEGDFTMPEGMERPEGGFQRPEGNFTMPEGDFTMPEGMERPEGGFQRPEGNFTMPEGDFTMPEGMERPEGGNMPQFGGAQGQTTSVDLKNAHISVQDGDIKAAGSMSDIKTGSFLTVTLNSKGEATEVLVSSMGNFGGFTGTGFGGNFGGRGQGGKTQGNGQTGQSA